MKTAFLSILISSLNAFNSTGPAILSASGNSQPDAFSSKIFAPVAFTSAATPFDVTAFVQETYVNTFTLSAIQGDAQGNPKWQGSSPILSPEYVDFIKNVRRTGGDVVVMFGGKGITSNLIPSRFSHFLC
jgi:hypothetical protein